MELNIFNSIIFGALQPWQTANQNELTFADLLRQAGRDLPTNAENLDKKLRLLLRHNPDVYQEVNINNNSILEPPIFENLIPRHFNHVTDYYLLLMQLSSLRFMNDLIAEVLETNHKIDNYYAVNTAAEKIKYISAGASSELARRKLITIPEYEINMHLSAEKNSERNTHLILFAAKQNSLKLFFDLQLRFREHLKSIETEEQFYSGTLREPYSLVLKLVPTNYFFDWHVNRLIRSVEYQSKDAVALLNFFKRHHPRNALTNAIAAVENFIFANLFDVQSGNYEIASLANFANFAEDFERVKQDISGRINHLNYRHQRFDLITEEMEKISIYNQSGFKSQSVLSKLHNWLNVQAEAYKGSLSNSFAIIQDLKVQSKKGNPLTRKEKTTTENLKSQAQEFLKHFSGFNIHQKKIMSETDYNRLIEYTFHLLEHEKLPKNIKPIPSIELSGNHIRYTYYLMHKSFFGTNEIKSVWIDFLQKVFTQLSNQDWNTLKTKFSVKPTKYDQDIGLLNT